MLQDLKPLGFLAGLGYLRMAPGYCALLLTLASSPALAASAISFSKLADTNTSSLTFPGSNISSFGNPSISGGTVAFRADTNVPGRFGMVDGGIYTYSGGTLRVAADLSSRPGDPTGAFTSFIGDPSISGNNIAFGAQYFPSLGSRLTSGLFIKNDAGITPIVSLNTPSLTFPGSNISSFGNPSISGGTVAFRADTNVPGRFGMVDGGIYTYSGGTLRVAADLSSRPGDPTGAFTSFIGDPSISGNNIAFGAQYFPSLGSRLTSGLFVDVDGTIEEILRVGEILDGLTIDQIDFGSDVIDGNSLAFRVGFTDGSIAIYRADLSTVDEPSGLALMVAAFGAFGIILRRRKGLCSVAQESVQRT